MTALGVLAEDLRRLGIAIILAAMIGSYFQDTVSALTALAGGMLGLVLWLAGVMLTRRIEYRG